MLVPGTGDVGGTGGMSAVVELVVVVQAVSTADAQPRENARRDNRGSDESEGGDIFKEFSCDATGDELGAWRVTVAQAVWLAGDYRGISRLLAEWLSHPVTALMIKHDDPRKQGKSARRV